MGELWTDHISFSQLTVADECPYSWFLMKVVGVKPAENAFAQAGTLAHQLLAEWAKGKTPAKALPQEWIERFPEVVTAEFPPYLKSKGYEDKLFQSILAYFQSFDCFAGYDILGVEKEFVSSLAGERFVGIIDLILRDRKSGSLMLVDHKSCSLASFKKTRDLKYRQLLLYSKYCADNYGTFPALLRFNLFKENVFDERNFEAKDYIAAKEWAEHEIETMKSRDLTDWLETRPEMFRCTNLCNCRNECLYGKAEKHHRKDETNGKRCPRAA